MHPYHLEVLAAERHRELRAEADRNRVSRHARHLAATGPRRSARPVIVLDALTAFARRWQRKVRAAFAVRAQKREPIRGF